MPPQKTEVKIETHETWVIRRLKRTTDGWCQRCARQVVLVTPEEASLITDAGLRQIFRHIELAQFHFLESTSGGILICLPSLLAERSGDNDND